MADLYLDVTQIIQYTKNYDTVRGIQRTQLNIMLCLANRNKIGKTHCIFFYKEDQSYYAFELSQQYMTGIADAEDFLEALAWINETGFFPGKPRIRKLEIYISALLFPARIKKMGLENPPPGFDIKPIQQLPADGVFILLGCDWFNKNVWAFAKKHKDNGGKTLQVVYDLIPIVYPDYYNERAALAFEKWLGSSLEYATNFICISKSAASDFRTFAENKGYYPDITVVNLAHEFLWRRQDGDTRQADGVAGLLHKPYVLCVGSIEYRKNNLMALRAWQRLLEDIPGQLPLLVFAGKAAKGYDEVMEFLCSRPELSAYVKIIQGPEDADLARLYQHCRFTVFLSRREGWGLPVGESAWFGKYCIASNASSIPEVCGDLMDYVDPDNLDDITMALKRAMTDDVYLARREERIKKAPAREWRHVANDFYSVL